MRKVNLSKLAPEKLAEPVCIAKNFIVQLSSTKIIICLLGMLFDDESRMIFLFQTNNNLAEIFSKCTSLVVTT